MTISIALAAFVLAVIAAAVGGLFRWIGGKMNLPDWASFALGLFFFELVLITAHVI